MCLAIPAQIKSVEGQRAVAELGGMQAAVVITMTPEAKVGDWVLVHAGYAITVVSEKDALETYALLKEVGLDGLSGQ